MKTTEKINHEKHNPEAWICLCGNTPSGSGFFPSNMEGTEVEPDDKWAVIYVCHDCGRIINQDTLEVIGWRKQGSPKELQTAQAA